MYHFIFVVKYRRPLLVVFGDEVKDIIADIAKKSKFQIEEIEVDKDHIHILVRSDTTLSPGDIAKRSKQGTTYQLWQNHPNLMKVYFWKEHVFWTPGYFVSTIGQVSEETIRAYIQNQG